MHRLSLYFNSPGEVIARREAIPSPAAGEVLVRVTLSAVSAGTEMLLYRGQFPEQLQVDDNLEALSGGFSYPIRYGYSSVGEIVQLGEGVEADLLGSRVFAFQPHTSHFVAEVSSLLFIPQDLTEEEAVFLPNMETAVGLTMDGAPMIGERVLIFGQGIVGLLTTALLALHPLESLVTLDRYSLRRQASLELGAQASLDPEDERLFDRVMQLNGWERSYEGADLAFELSGTPGALNQAISLSGFEGRIVVGSFYGKKRSEIDLGAKFHRQRLKLISSQVSSLNPRLSGRWDKDRRFQVAWEMLKRIKPARLITHSFPISEAEAAYRLLDTNPGQAIQVVFEY